MGNYSFSLFTLPQILRWPRAVSFPFLPRIFLAAPNQHHPLLVLREKPDNTAPPLLPGALFHIHSKTACRGFKSFCPCQKSQVSLVRYLTFSLVCGMIWQQGAPAGPPAVRVVGRWSPVATVQRRPRRQPRQVLLPLPQNRRKHWGFAGFLFSCVALLSGAFWFGFLVSPSVRTRCTSLQHPKRTRFRLFRAESGAFRHFCPLLTCKIFGSAFVHFVA